MTMQTITITNPKVWDLARMKASKLGISIREYFNRLVLRDTHDPWGPVPKWLSEVWDKEVAAFEKEDKKHPRPRFTSGDDFVEYIRRKT